MASTSTSAMGSSSGNDDRYDVFLSFRGEDTRNNFADHLYEALVQAGVHTFRDNDEIDRGQELKPEIERAIRESKASIVVLSENYATSTWCLDELLLILEQRRECNHFVLPVFYQVEPSDIGKQKKTFQIEVESGSRWTDENVSRWKAALTNVAELAGIGVVGPETKKIQEIVDKIALTLQLRPVSTRADLQGIDTRANDINDWLKQESGGNMLAICGMGGSGKTTLAEHVYDSNMHKFKSSSLLLRIGERLKEKRANLGELQEQLLTDIVGGTGIEKSSHRYSIKIARALQMKRVLIVLDDIDENDQLDVLIGAKVSDTKSKIIITTTRLDIANYLESISWTCRMYRLKLLDHGESLNHFSRHAFRSKSPMEGFEDLTTWLVNYCNGNPLGLKVLGSSLKDSNLGTWRATIKSLNSSKGDLDCNIQNVLRRSYDSLPRDSDRNLFLHISFFFVGEFEDDVITILESDWPAEDGIRTLSNRCLLTVLPSKKLLIHQLLQEMARTIVRKKYEDSPATCSIVWDRHAYYVLKNHDSKPIEGLALDMSNVEEGRMARRAVSAFNTDSFKNLHSLKLLQLKNMEPFTGSYTNFPELTWLCWHGLASKTIHSGLLMSSLVAIDMSYGKVEKFELPMIFNSLKILSFKGCGKLERIRNLYQLPNLESLILRDCSSLTQLCKHIRDLKKLALLDLTGCEKICKVNYGCMMSLFSQQGIPELPHSLKFLLVNHCGFQDNNDFTVIFNGQPSFHMSLGNNLFQFLPSNIDLNMLRVLDVTSCPNLKSLPCLPSTLQELYTYWCASLEEITFESGCFRLRKFGYEGCYQLSEVQGLFKLVYVNKMNEADLGHMEWIKAYKDYTMDLVGVEITRHRIRSIQMLYEYGIRSIYLPGTIGDKCMHRSQYKSTSSSSLSFHVPPCPNNHRFQGLDITFSYTEHGTDADMWVLFIKIRNITKRLTWIYNPMMYGKTQVGAVACLSYWPIGNTLDTDDEIKVSIIGRNGLLTGGCGVRLVEQENPGNNTEREEVGGDIYMSGFELTEGVYYVCCRNFFESSTPAWSEAVFDDPIDDSTREKLQRWRDSYQSPSLQSFRETKSYRGMHFKEYRSLVSASS